MNSIEGEIRALIDEFFPVIHIVHDGYAICKFTLMRPEFWPEGEDFVFFRSGEKATCPECLKIFEDGPPTRREGRKLS